jgi:hypothetical protein
MKTGQIMIILFLSNGLILQKFKEKTGGIENSKRDPPSERIWDKILE